MNAMLEMPRLGLRAIEVVRRSRDVVVAEALGLAGSAPAKDIPAAVELCLDRLQSLAVDWIEVPAGMSRAKPMLLIHELLDATADRLLVHARRVLGPKSATRGARHPVASTAHGTGPSG